MSFSHDAQSNQPKAPSYHPIHSSYATQFKTAILAILAIVLILQAFDIVKGQDETTTDRDQCLNCDHNTKKNIPQVVYDAGLYKVHLFYNHTNYRDRLRLSKAWVKAKVLGYSLGSKGLVPLSTSKYWHSIELRPCDVSLGLVQTDVEPLIYCQSFENHLQEEDANSPSPRVMKNGPDSSKSKTFSGTYAKKRTVRTKFKLGVLDEINLAGGAHYYALKPDVVKKQINHATGFNLGFGSDQFDFGYYFEANMSTDPLPIRCSGQLFLALNITQPPGWGPYDHHPDFAHFWQYLLDGVPNGFMLNMKDVICELIKDENDPIQSLFKLRVTTDLVLIRRQKFPYWTCKHTVGTSPLKSIFEYIGIIEQHKKNPNDKTYNTTINLEANSIFMKHDNFKLKQVFVHNEETNAVFEEMIFVNPYISATVKGAWTNESFSKILELFVMDKLYREIDRTLETTVDRFKFNLNPFAQISFENQDQYIFKFAVKKNILEQMAASREVIRNTNYDIPTLDQLIDELRQRDSGERSEDSPHIEL